MENSEKYIVEANPPIVDKWSEIEDIRDKVDYTSTTIDRYIEEDMKQYPDDKQLDDFLESIPSTIEGEYLMPSCISEYEYCKDILYNEENRPQLDLYNLEIQDIEQDRDEYVEYVRNKALKEYKTKYLPKYRRELRAWYIRNKRQHLFNLHEEGENINESISK